MSKLRFAGDATRLLLSFAESAGGLTLPEYSLLEWLRHSSGEGKRPASRSDFPCRELNCAFACSSSPNLLQIKLDLDRGNLRGFLIPFKEALHWVGRKEAHLSVTKENLIRVIGLRKVGLRFSWSAVKVLESVACGVFDGGESLAPIRVHSSANKTVAIARVWGSGVIQIDLRQYPQAKPLIAGCHFPFAIGEEDIATTAFSQVAASTLEGRGIQIESRDLRKRYVHLIDEKGRVLVAGKSITQKEIPWKAFCQGKWDTLRKGWIMPPPCEQRFIALAQMNAAGFVIDPDLSGEIEKGRVLLQKLTPSPKELFDLSFSLEAKPTTIPGFSGTLDPYQEAGLQYCLKTERLFNGDDMGLGKTVVSLAFIQKLKAFPALILSPKSVCEKWKRETSKFLPNATVSHRVEDRADVTILSSSSSKLSHSLLKLVPYQSLIVDESHGYKERTSKRVKALLEILAVNPIRYRVCLTGTPVQNRNEEWVSQLEILDRLDQFGGYWKFVQRYCAGVKTKFGLKTDGSINSDELNQRLRETCFFRRKKEDALPDLPPKSRKLIDVPLSNEKEYRVVHERFVSLLRSSRARELQKFSGAFTQTHVRTKESPSEVVTLLSKLRMLVSEGKIEAATQHIKTLLRTNKKLVVFAVHRETIKILHQRFPDALLVTGAKSNNRQQIIDQFQEDPSKRLIIVSIRAAETGIELTAAHTSLTIEWWWDPSTMFQVEDRLCRRGQLSPVTNYYLTAPDTTDDFMRHCLRKKFVITRSSVEGQKTRNINIGEELVRFYASRKPLHKTA